LETRHFATVPFNMSRSEVESAANAFLEFLTLPESVKRQLHFPARSHRASADGFTNKIDTDQKDPKQFFHWSPMLVGKEPYRRLREFHPQIEGFFHYSERLYHQVESTLFEIYNHHLPEFRDQIFEGERLVDGILRFLCYTPRPEHSFCAQAHFDKGFSTLAIADSAPGLRIGCCNKHSLTPVEHREGAAIFMPAWMMFHASQGDIKPAWHDVIHSPSEQDVNQYCARWSIVFFVNNPEIDFCSWEDAHTPLH
ncbi:MAG: 2OG-Fe(II) oxygenase family protein, partial [bacterium]